MWPTDRYGIVHRAAALDAGIPERTINRAVQSGELLIVARGSYLPSNTLRGGPSAADALYRVRCIAAGTGQSRLVLSHDSAAAVHGLQTLFADRTRIHLTNCRPDGGYTTGRRVVHTGVLSDDEVAEVDGVLVTTIDRTVVDLALSATSFEQALAALDAGLRAGASPAYVERAFAERRRGVALARRAYRYADGLSESPGESASRAQMIDDGLPVPDLQVEYQLRSGRLARCDFGMEGRFVGEFDGLAKYRRDIRGGEDPEDVVIREKVREDELRDLGLDVARWIWADLKAGRLPGIIRHHYDRIGIRY